MSILTITILGLLILLSVFSFIKEIQEISFLKKTLKLVIGKTQIESTEDLVKIKNYLNKNISFNPELKTKKRPLLRHTASYILKSKYGFCGENARVAIKLLLLGGVKANRIYLFRKEWEHVLVEHKLNGAWYMFDGHNDPLTFLKDRDVASIQSKNILEYPNEYPNNPYLNFCRIKLFYKILFLKSLSKIRLPSFFTYILESPYLIKSIFFVCLSLILMLLSLVNFT